MADRDFPKTASACISDRGRDQPPFCFTDPGAVSGNNDKIAKMAILYDGQVKMAHLAIVAGYSVNGVARLHTEILKKEQLKDFYEMMPQKFNNKTNGITQRRFLAHANRFWLTG